MPEHVVVVVGSNASLPEFTQGQFWVIDFSSAPTGAPTAVPVTTTTGVVVDCSGTLAAVATTTPPFGGSSTVSIYDVSNPARPRSIGSATLTSFGGISAISFYGGYVLAAEANGSQVALIDINDLDNPQTYPTGFDTVTDVTLFGSNAVICGVSASSNAFLLVNTANLSNLANMATTNVNPYNGDAYTSLMCDFDGTNAVFSDGLGLYAFNVSGGTPTALSSFSALATSVAIAESENSSGLPTGGVQVAYTAASDANVELQYVGAPRPAGNELVRQQRQPRRPQQHLRSAKRDERRSRQIFPLDLGNQRPSRRRRGYRDQRGRAGVCRLAFRPQRRRRVDPGDAARRADPGLVGDDARAKLDARPHHFLHLPAVVSSANAALAVAAVDRVGVTGGG